MDNRTLLKDLVLAGRKEEAARVARSLGPQAGDALLEASSSPRSSVRMLALELAADHPSPGSCRTVLGRLSDSNATVRSVAGSLVRICRDHDNAPDLVKALDQQQDASIRNSVVAQLGIAGSHENVPLLRRLSHDPQLANSASLALVQLGDTQERRRLIKRLSDDDLQTRTDALRDVSTVGDPKLAAWLGPALADVRDAVPISMPHVSPAVYARVCDFAVMVMAQLGYHFSFPVNFLERRPLEQIQEAARMVEAMPRENR
jgi:HEAT repeat protein